MSASVDGEGRIAQLQQQSSRQPRYDALVVGQVVELVVIFLSTLGPGHITCFRNRFNSIAKITGPGSVISLQSCGYIVQPACHPVIFKAVPKSLGFCCDGFAEKSTPIAKQFEDETIRVLYHTMMSIDRSTMAEGRGYHVGVYGVLAHFISSRKPEEQYLLIAARVILDQGLRAMQATAKVWKARGNLGRGEGLRQLIDITRESTSRDRAEPMLRLIVLSLTMTFNFVRASAFDLTPWLWAMKQSGRLVGGASKTR